jgi:hypothetical protein
MQPAKIFFTGDRLGLTLKQSHLIIFLRGETFEKKIKIRKKWNFFLDFFDQIQVKRCQMSKL